MVPRWRTDFDNLTRSYGYTYDALNRLTNAQYVRPSNPANPNASDIIDTFNETLSYDKNGNIQYLVRNGGMESQTTVPVMDNLVYGYDANDKNKLLKVTDATDNTDGFKDGADNQEEYGYDLNGNMTRDDNKGITSIVYNHLNLPTKIEFNNDINTKIEYLYTAVGQKIQKNVFKYHQQISASLEPAPAIATDYLGGFQYVSGGLQFFPTAEGYVKYTEEVRNPFDYVFNYTDHLGNIRLSYGINPDTGLLKKMEENNYYPFGLKHATYNTEEIIIVPRKKPGIPEPETGRFGKFMIQKEETIIMKTPILDIDPPIDDTPIAENSGYNYKYNGKELQDELGLNMYDYGWRNYMPDLGRWTQIDPLFNDLKFANDNSQVDDEDDQEEVYMSIINDLEIGGGIYNTDNLNPYGYGYNNPVSFDDPDGRCPACWGALIGAGVDIALQMTSNAVQGKDLTDINWKQVGVSAVAGAISGGISSISQIKNASTVVKIGVEVATDTGISVGSQAIKDGKVSLKKTAIDVGAGQLIGRGVGKVVEKRLVNSAKAKQLQANVNREKNVARGKSNTTPRSKADVNTAKKKLDSYVSKRSSASSATASGAASTAVEKIDEKRKKK